MRRSARTLAVCAAIVAAVFSALSADAGNPYHSHALGLTAQLPAGWKAEEHPGMVTFTAPWALGRPFHPNVNVRFEDLNAVPMPVTLQAYQEMSLRNAPKWVAAFQLHDLAPATIGGHPAFRNVYVGTEHAQPFKFVAYMLIVGKRAYTIRFSAMAKHFDSNLVDAERLMQSIRLEETA